MPFLLRKRQHFGLQIMGYRLKLKWVTGYCFTDYRLHGWMIGGNFITLQINRLYGTTWIFFWKTRRLAGISCTCQINLYDSAKFPRRVEVRSMRPIASRRSFRSFKYCWRFRAYVSERKDSFLRGGIWLVDGNFLPNANSSRPWIYQRWTATWCKGKDTSNFKDAHRLTQ